MNQSTEISVFDIKPEDLLTGLKPAAKFLEAIKGEIAQTPVDLTTTKGRDQVRADTTKVTKTKTGIEKAAKAMTAEFRKKTKSVNDERDLLVAELQTIQDATRKPLTDWEDAKEKRLADLKERLGVFDLERATFDMSSDDLMTIIAEVDAIGVGADWDEYQPIAKKKQEEFLTVHRLTLASAQRREKDAADLARLRAEAAERDQQEAERKAAEDLARSQTEAAARIERDKADAIARAEQERIAAQQRAEREAKAREDAEAAEALRVKEAAKHAEIEAQRRADAAVLAERQGQAREKADRDAADAKRAADVKRRAQVAAEIAEDIDMMGSSEIVAALMAGNVRHVTVNF